MTTKKKRKADNVVPIRADEEGPPMTAVTMLADPGLNMNEFILSGVDTSAKPLYSVSEMAKFFFGRTSHWVRWLEGENKMVLDDEALVPIRTNSNARKYDLAMVEKIAHALAENQAITVNQLRHALTIVKTQAQMYGYIPGGD